MFYVYVYKDPRPTKNLQVVYVGKGTGSRMYSHWRKKVHKNPAFGAFLAQLRKRELEPVIEVVATFENEDDALAEEVRLITQYGRRDIGTGALFNLTDGGEGISGAVRTEVWVARMKAALTTPDQIAANSERMKKLWNTPEHREKTVDAIRKAVHDPEVAARREAAKAVSHKTIEFRETMRAASSERWKNPEYVTKVVAAQKAAQNTPEALAKKAKNSKKLWQSKKDVMTASIKRGRSTEESREKTSRQAKAQWGDPEYAKAQTERNREIASRDNVRKAKSLALSAVWSDPEKRAARAAAIRAGAEGQKKSVYVLRPDGSVEEYSSVTAAVNALRVSKSTLIAACRTGKVGVKGSLRGCRVSYENFSA